MGIKLIKCNCEGWKQHQVFTSFKSLMNDFVYCPWCGRELEKYDRKLKYTDKIDLQKELKARGLTYNEKKIKKALLSLTPRQRRAFELRYGFNGVSKHTYSEINKIFGTQYAARSHVGHACYKISKCLEYDSNYIEAKRKDRAKRREKWRKYREERRVQ